jgi:hypothetical protein
MPARRLSIAEKLHKHTKKTSGCWLWTGNRPDGRYGHLKHLGRTLQAHRASFEHFVGAIPHGLWVLHRCDNPGCVRPDHLFLGTPADNVLDKIAKRRGGIGETHGRAILTEAAVHDIRAVMNAPGRKDGRRIALSAKYGVSATRISHVASGKEWAWLDA